MTVLAADPFVTAEQAAHHGVELVSFDDLLARADVDHRPRAADAGDPRADRDATSSPG